MKNLIGLTCVTYTRENGKRVKVKFYTFEDDGKNEKYYKILNEELNVDMIVSMEEGNDYFKEILQYDKNAIINKVV